jgi:hypothetical protein
VSGAKPGQSRRRRDERPLSRGLLAAVWTPVVLLVPAGLANVLLPGATGPDSPGFAFVLFAGITAVYSGVGAFVIGRAPRNAVGWILWLIGLLIGLNVAATAYGAWSLAAFDGTLPGTVLAGWITQWAFSPPLVMALLLLPLLFPDGRPPSPRWRWLIVFSLVVVVVSALPDMLAPGTLGPSGVQNPTAWPGDPVVLDAVRAFSTISPLVALPIVIASAVVRYRRGSPIERAQLRWFGATAALSLAALAVATLTTDPIAIIAWVTAMVGIGLLPIAIGMAIVRYRLWDIDRIISRTLSYALVTMMLAAVFAVLVLALQTALAAVTGAGGTLAIAASTLAVFALFQPVRGRVQRLVDRRFNRSRVDSEAALAELAGQLRDETDLDRVAARVEQAVHRSMAPARTSIWTRSR